MFLACYHIYKLQVSLLDIFRTCYTWSKCYEQDGQ